MSAITSICDRHGAVVALRDGSCPWCDQPTRARRHAGGKPKGKYRYLTDDQIRAAHALYIGKGLSLRKLGQLLYERFGYASATSCANQLNQAFIDAGLPRRGRIQATVEASTTHGLAPREGQTQEQRDQLNKLRRERRDRQPMCAGVRSQYPRKGEPCQRPATRGSEFCLAHDPARKAERERRLEDARAWKGVS